MTPLAQEEKGSQETLAFASQVVIHRGTGAQHPVVEVGTVSVDHPDLEAVDQECRHRAKEPHLTIVHIGWGDNHKDGQIGIMAEYTIRRWCSEGKLPAFRIGREWCINKAELDKIAGCNEASAPKDDE